jgi:hypothetical protein
MQPTLAVIDIDIHAGQDEVAREKLLENLTRFKEACITPLWVNWLRERADLRVVCLVHDLLRFDDFLVDVIRCVPGVRGTAAQLAFDGVVHGDAVADLPLQNSIWNRRAAATVLVKSEPGQDRQVYRALVELPKHEEVVLLLLGERTSALTGYVMSWVRAVPGVVDTQLTSVLDWQVLGRIEDFITLSQRFPRPR